MSLPNPPGEAVPYEPPRLPSSLQPLESGDPQRVGKYQLLGRLGGGGMGRVFLGWSPGGRLVAVKLIRPELAADAAFRIRFGREVEAARRVGGMFTAPVVDADPLAPQPWLVTAYVPGPPLADVVGRQGPLPARSVLLLAAGLAEGLQAVHAAGVVHRDLKPSNVLLAGDGPRIIDFGISRALEGAGVTRTDQVIGSPGFMSPEQAEGHEAGSPSDVFSLGSVLAFAASGQTPFGSGPATALLYRVVHSPPAIGGLSPQLRPLIERCLAKDPQQRPTTSQILAELGAPQLAADWLPPAIGQVLPGYDLPDSAVAVSLESQAGRTPTRAVADSPPADPATVSAVGRDHPSLAATLLGHGPGVGQRPLRRQWRRRTWTWAVGALAAVLAVTATAIALTFRPSGRGPQRIASTLGSHVAQPPSAQVIGPRAVVEEYFAAINAHNWRRVWRLGSKNLGFPYPAMVAGFRLTARDVLTSITSRGTTVSVRFRAYETTGAVQTYQARYTVQDGVITTGQQTLLATRPPALTVVYDCQGNPETQPSSYILACADGGISLSYITWSSWTTSRAVGSGQLAVNNCQPDCADGTFGYTPATVTLSRPALGTNGPYFTHLKIADSSVSANVGNWTLGTHGPGS